MNPWMLSPMSAILVGAAVGLSACGGSASPSKSSIESTDVVDTPWRLVVVRADGTTEVFDSVSAPIICSTQQNPKIVYFCLEPIVNGRRIFADFLPFNVDSGDTYAVEGPPRPSQSDNDGTPTPTAIGP